MTKPLFIWAGGKTKMLKHYKPLLPKTFTAYYEPFLGGGAMFLHVRKTNACPAYLNDINPDIMRVYQVIQSDQVHEFLKEMDEISSAYLALDKKGRRDYYFHIRELNAFHYHGWSECRAAAVMYFLLKTCFNGIYQINKNTGGRFGTPCGLLNQKDKVYDRQAVLEWHQHLQSTTLTAKHWRDACPIHDHAFYFLDPPYRGCFTSYGEVFDDQYQRELVEFAHQIPASSCIFLCNRDTGDGFFEAIKRDLHLEYFDVTYTAGRRKRIKCESVITGYEAKKAREVLITNLKNGKV